MYFANLWIKRKVLTPAGAGLDLREVVVRSPQVIGRRLAEVSAELPAGVRIFAVRKGNQNRVPAPDIVLADNDIVALAGESEEALESARLFVGEASAGRITADRGDLDYFRLFVSRPAVVGVSLADLRIPDVPEFSVMHVRRGDADILPSSAAFLLWFITFAMPVGNFWMKLSASAFILALFGLKPVLGMKDRLFGVTARSVAWASCLRFFFTLFSGPAEKCPWHCFLLPRGRSGMST